MLKTWAIKTPANAYPRPSRTPHAAADIVLSPPQPAAPFRFARPVVFIGMALTKKSTC